MNRRSVAVGFAWTFLFNFVSQAVFPILGLVIARILGPGQMGHYLLLLQILTFVEVFRDAGLSLTYIADSDGSPERRGAYFGLAIVSALVAATVLIALRQPLAAFFQIPDLAWSVPIVAAVVIVTGLTTIPKAELLRQERFRDSGIAEVVPTFLSYLVGLTMVLLGHGYAGLIAQMVCRAVFYVPFAFRMAPPPRPVFRLRAMAELSKKARGVMATNLLGTVFHLVDGLFVTKVFGTVANGWYGLAKSWAQKPFDFFSNPLSRTLYVAYSKQTEDAARFAHVYRRSLAAALLFAVPVYGGLFFLAKPIVLTLLGDKFLGSVVPFACLCVFFGLRSLGTLAGYALTASGRGYAPAWCWLGAIVVVVGGIAGTWGREAFNEGAVRLFGGPGGVWGPTALEVGKGPSHLGTGLFAAWLAVGAVVVYGASLVWAARVFPSDADSRSRTGKAALASLATCALAFGLSLAPLGDVPLTVVGATTLPLVHLAVVGMALAGRPQAYLSPRGLRDLYRAV
ncbi:MAG: oligosaccharide flippase family protein [Fimbriimonadaceae bacterium]|nr:oligosaccharide flippase family protein [Fimbriimonadaceae bacterium]